MLAYMLVGAAAFVLGIVVFFIVLKYLGIFTAIVFVAVFYFVGYASAIFAGAFWFFGLWLLGEEHIYLTTAISLLLFLLIRISTEPRASTALSTIRLASALSETSPEIATTFTP